METLTATRLSSKVSEHLNIISGALSLHLEEPHVQIVVHGIPTDLPLELLQKELCTFNTSVNLASLPCWLITLQQRKDEKASSGVISRIVARAQV